MFLGMVGPYGCCPGHAAGPNGPVDPARPAGTGNPEREGAEGGKGEAYPVCGARDSGVDRARTRGDAGEGWPPKSMEGGNQRSLPDLT